jgi:hypothetical protein
MNGLIHNNIKAIFKYSIWLSNEEIDNVINTQNFEYLGTKDYLQFLLRDSEDSSDLEYIIIDNNLDRHLFVSIRKNIYRKDTNNYKIGYIKGKCRTFVYHFDDTNKFTKFLHENEGACISNFLNISNEDSAPKDL